ncbi:MAG: tetratricopeptide repeat protein [Planctomycetota bacterium]|jgi:tetratricopeptide (TPR) repeat protein|nr:tetratricopeptide repeat protein [Planctomycetota bacterium]
MPRSKSMVSALLFLCILLPSSVGTGQEDSTDFQNILTRAKDLLRRGSHETALRTLRKIPDESELSRPKTLLQFRILRTLGRIDDLESMLRKRLTKHPKEPLSWALLGEVLAHRGRRGPARQAFEKALTNDPKNIPALFGRAHLDFQSGKRTQALSTFLELKKRYFRESIQNPRDLLFIGKGARILGMRTETEPRTSALEFVTIEIMPEIIDRDSTYAEAYEEMGRVWLDAYDTPAAKENYQDASKAIVDNPLLLTGLAHAYLQRFSMRPRAVPILNRALAINPNFLPAHATLAAIHAGDEEYAKARKHIDHILRINPDHLEGLSLLAGFHLLRGEDKPYAEIERKVLGLNPKYGQFYFTVAELVLSKRQFQQAVSLLHRSIELDPKLWHAQIELGQNYLRTGDEEKARKVLEEVFREFPYHTQTKNVLRLLETYDDYVVERHGPFRVRLHNSEDKVIRPYLNDLLDRSYRDLQKRYQFTPEGPLLIEMFHDHQDFAVRSVGIMGLGALGVCFGKVVTLDSPKARNGKFNWASTTWHELAHVFTLQMSDYRVPRWFTEGLSGLEEKHTHPSWLREKYIPLHRAWSSGRLRGIETLNAGFTRPRFGGEVILCYFQAALVCEFIENTFGWDKILDMLRGYADRKNTTEILREVLKVNPKEFDSRFIAYLKQNYFDRIRILPSFSEETKEDLKDLLEDSPEDDTNRLRLAIAYYERGNLIDASAQAGRIRKRDAKTHLLLGQIAYRQKAYGRSRELLQKAFDMGFHTYQAHLMMGSMYSNTSPDPKRAIHHFREAKKAFPWAVGPQSPHLRLWMMYQKTGNIPAALQELVEYVEITGEDFKHRVILAKGLLEQGQTRQALRYLQESIETNFYNLEVHRLLADTLRSTHDLDLALREARTCVELSTDKDRHLDQTRLAAIHIDRKEWKAARFILEDILESHPDYDPAQALFKNIQENSSAEPKDREKDK